MATDTKTFNAANEDTSSTVSATSQYDAAGNAIVTPMPGSETIGLTCTYDAWNRLVSASDGTTTVTYQYDGTGRRTERTQGGTTEHDYYSGQQVIQVYDYNGPVSPANFQGGQQYIWSPLYIDTPILRDTYDSSGDRVPGKQLYYTADADHNVTAVVQNNTIDGAWEAAERYSYDAYGDVTVYDKYWSPITGNQSQPGIDNTRLFAGMDADPLTGAYYDNVRWYDPTNGTFFGRDPIASSANLYEYCGDDPLTRADPLGLWWTGDTIPGISFGPNVNMNPAVPESPDPSSYECPPGYTKYVDESHDDHVRWMTLASKEDTIVGSYDGFWGGTEYVYQGTFTLQRDLRHAWRKVSCKRYETVWDPQSCSLDTYEFSAGGGKEGEYYLGACRVVFSGKKYPGTSKIDPGAISNIITVVELVIAVAGAIG